PPGGRTTILTGRLIRRGALSRASRRRAANPVQGYVRPTWTYSDSRPRSSARYKRPASWTAASENCAPQETHHPPLKATSTAGRGAAHWGQVTSFIGAPPCRGGLSGSASRQEAAGADISAISGR